MGFKKLFEVASRFEKSAAKSDPPVPSSQEPASWHHFQAGEEKIPVTEDEPALQEEPEIVKDVPIEEATEPEEAPDTVREPTPEWAEEAPEKQPVLLVIDRKELTPFITFLNQSLTNLERYWIRKSKGELSTHQIKHVERMRNIVNRIKDLETKAP
jgi:hypothetical protein